MRIDTCWTWLSRHAMGVAFGAIGLALLLAALLSAPLTWDGAYYLLHMLNTGKAFIAQGRVADGYLHQPVIWTMNLTDSQQIIGFVFSLIHVVAPLIALMLSWWVIRTTHRYLMIWPALAIGMALLPGQINFISEGIKAEQLMWPMLLAVVIGAPRRTMPLIVALAITIYFLHPVSAPILIATGMAGLGVALFRPADRARLLTIGSAKITAGIYRFVGISSGYEQSEMTWATQQRQWENGAGGWPIAALVCSLIVTVTVLVRPWLSESAAGSVSRVQLVAIGVSTVALLIWAAQPTQWWEALEFRGPAFWISMLLAGCLFLHVVTNHFVKNAEPEFPSRQIVLISVGFSLVILVQSIAWNGIMRDLRDRLNASSHACLAREDLAGYPYTPLNLWSTNALSLLEQGTTPTKMSMTNAQCHDAKESGAIMIGSGDYARTIRKFDFSILQGNLLVGTMCSWHHTDGWYQQEALIPDSWRWTGESGTILISLESPSTVTIEGEFQTIPRPNQIEISANGTHITTIDVDSESRMKFSDISIELPAGTSEITFRSVNPPETLPNDERPLAISLWNPVIRPGDGSSPCLQEDAP